MKVAGLKRCHQVEKPNSNSLLLTHGLLGYKKKKRKKKKRKKEREKKRGEKKAGNVHLPSTRETNQLPGNSCCLFIRSGTN